MKNKLKIIFVDIDWTILDHSKIPAEFDLKSIKALQKCQENGIKVFICSARPYHSIDQVKILDLFTPDGIICSNGGLIIYNKQIIYRTYIPQEDFNKLCELANEYGANVEGIRPYDCFIINENYDDIKAVHATYPEEMPKIENYHNQDILGIGLFTKEEFDELFIKSLPNLKYYFRFHPHGVDIANEIHDKGESVKFVLDYLKIKRSEAASFGDDLQDMTMFDETEYSFAMDNAKDEVKKAAKYITKSVSESGVAHALELLTESDI